MVKVAALLRVSALLRRAVVARAAAAVREAVREVTVPPDMVAATDIVMVTEAVVAREAADAERHTTPHHARNCFPQIQDQEQRTAKAQIYNGQKSMEWVCYNKSVSGFLCLRFYLMLNAGCSGHLGIGFKSLGVLAYSKVVVLLGY